MRILTPESMQAVDRAAVEEFGVPSLVLMENAAIGVADAVSEVFPEAGAVAIYCGPGNNGGDGLAVGRHLAIRGYHVELFLVAGGREPGGDAGVQLTICRNQGLPVREVGPEDALHGVLQAGSDCGVVIDALFGTGLGRPLEGQYAELVAALNRLPVARVAVDLPSGLMGGRWDIPGPHVEAGLTVTFAAPKIAHIFPPASEAVGQVVVADLGIPRELVERADGYLHLLIGDDLADCLAPRPEDSHKGDYGHALLLAGSPGKSGAAILAARAAVRAGAGLVTVAVPEPILPTVDLGCLESMSLPLPVGEGAALMPAAADGVLAAAADKQVVALGPGLGTAPTTVAVVERVVAECALPLVIDADGLNALAGSLALVAGRSAPTVLTPHPGELGRLLGVPTNEVVADRVLAVRTAARQAKAIVVLKGHLSLISDRDGQVYVNPTGNAGMATGGSGDVLTGIIAGFVAQGFDALLATQIGVYAHGLAGDRAAERRGQTALTAGDLLDGLPEALESLGE